LFLSFHTFHQWYRRILVASLLHAGLALCALTHSQSGGSWSCEQSVGDPSIANQDHRSRMTSLKKEQLIRRWRVSSVTWWQRAQTLLCCKPLAARLSDVMIFWCIADDPIFFYFCLYFDFPKFSHSKRGIRSLKLHFIRRGYGVRAICHPFPDYRILLQVIQTDVSDEQPKLEVFLEFLRS
jgi:hypothetical protein